MLSIIYLSFVSYMSNGKNTHSRTSLELEYPDFDTRRSHTV